MIHDGDCDGDDNDGIGTWMWMGDGLRDINGKGRGKEKIQGYWRVNRGIYLTEGWTQHSETNLADNAGGELIKVQGTHMWNYHNETPSYY
jgi:hypothetical protein